MTQADTSLLEARLRVDRLPPGGRTLAIATSPAEREAIAARLEIAGVESLSASLTASAIRGGVHVRGRLRADVVQSCVVSGAPVAESVEEPVDRVFMPGPPPEAVEGADGLIIDIEADDPPDYFEGAEIDLSELLFETLSLGLNPYPRAPGAALGCDRADAESVENSPFSILKGLKNKPD